MDEVEKAQETFKKPKSKAKIVIILLLIVIIAAGGAVGAYFLLNSPKKAFEKSMESANKFIEEKVLGSFSSNKFVYDSNKVLEADIKLYGEVTAGEDSYYTDEVTMINNLIKNIKLDVKSKLDLQNKSIYAYLGLEENNQISIAGEAFLNRDMIIGKLQDVSDSLFYAKTSDMGTDVKTVIDSMFDSMANPNSQNSDDIVKDYKDIIKKSISDKQYKTENTVISIDGSDKKVKKASLELTEKEIKTILKDIINKAKTDDRILDPLVSSMGTTSIYTPEKMKEELAKSFDEAIKQIDELEFACKLTISTYTQGSKLVQFKIDLSITVEGQTVTASITMDCADENNIKITFEVKYGGISYKVKLDIVKDGNKTTATLDFGSLIGIKAIFETTKVSDSRKEVKAELLQSGQSMLIIRCNTDYLANSKDEINKKDEIIVEVDPFGNAQDIISAKLIIETKWFYTDSVQVPSIGGNDIDIINGEIPNEFLVKLENKLNGMQIIKDIMAIQEKAMAPSTTPGIEDFDFGEDFDFYTDIVNP